MTEVFDNKFHRWYVGGVGEVREQKLTAKTDGQPIQITREEALAQYRKYVGDPTAELPEEILEWYELLEKSRTENDRQ